MGKKSPWMNTRVPSAPEGELFPANAERDFRVCRIQNQLVRVWGAEGRRVSSEVIAALRPVTRVLRSELPYALMPDFHPAEYGVVGSVIPSEELIVPALIGSDAGCGVCAHRLGRVVLPDPSRLQGLYEAIARRIPTGSNEHRTRPREASDLPLWARLASLPFAKKFELSKLERQFGTLGGGNHFIELGQDENDDLWLMVHTGSRFLGGLLARHYGKKTLEIGSDEAHAFMRDHEVVLDYAAESRRAIASAVLALFPSVLHQQPRFEESIDLVHNFVKFESQEGRSIAVHRKGACRAREGELGIIPGSMGTSSFIVRGRGVAESYASSSHGAGRVLARGQAFRTLRPSDLQRDMKGIIWSGSDKLRDESPRAYKDIRHVMKAQSELVGQVHTLRPLLSVKGE